MKKSEKEIFTDRIAGAANFAISVNSFLVRFAISVIGIIVLFFLSILFSYTCPTCPDVAAKDAAIDSLTQANNVLIEKLELANASIDLLQGNNKELKEALYKCDNELGVAKSENLKLGEKNSQQEKNLKFSEKKIFELREGIAQIFAKNDSLQTQNNNLLQKCESLQRTIDRQYQIIRDKLVEYGTSVLLFFLLLLFRIPITSAVENLFDLF